METSQEILKALGMTLIHSFWQGGVIAAIIMILLLFIGRNNARARYALHFTALLTLLISFIITFIIISRNNYAIEELRHTVQNLSQGIDIVNEFPVPGKGFLAAILVFLEPFSPWFAFFWLAGFIFSGIRITGGAIAARMLFRRDLTLPDEYLLELFDNLKKNMGIISRVSIKISRRMISPLVTGVLTPMVIIPAVAVTGMSCEQLKAVIIHELAHIRRHDPVFALIQAFARLVLFFHPLAWYLIREIDRERENCCDDFVVRKNNNPIHYIKALAMIQEMNLPQAGANSLAGRSSQLLNRIMRLVKPQTRYTAAFRLSVITLSVILLASISMAFIINEKPDLKSKAAFHQEPLNKADPQINKTAVVQYDKDGDKKKMVIIFNNDTISEITVNGKKLSQEEMKQYAQDIRKVQSQLEGSRYELQQMQNELQDAQKQMEIAQWKLQQNNLSNQLKNEWNLKNLNYELWKEAEFQEKMKSFREEAWKKFRESEEKWNSEEFREEMKKAWEEAGKGFEEFQLKFKTENDFNFSVPPFPGFNGQEPPAPRPDKEMNIVPEVPEIPEIPEAKEQIEIQELQERIEAPEIDEQIEAPEMPESEIEMQIEKHEKMEINDTNDKSTPDPKAGELDSKLRELEKE